MVNMPPHGACWLWNRYLIFLHAGADLLTFVAYVTIPLIVLFIYRRGRLQRLAASYPQLWRLGAAFVFFCGISHLGSFMEVWYGNGLYWVTAANKTVMAVASLWFARRLWVRRYELASIGSALNALQDREATQ